MIPSDNEFVFKEGPTGLEFVGDFEGLYRTDADPWHQSGEASYAIQQYYNNSRVQLVSALRRRLPNHAVSGLEIGCGHGHVVDLLSSATVLRWDGVDISDTAVRQARKLFPDRHFFRRDITEYPLKFAASYDVVILGQVLWYVMHLMPTVMDNCYHLLQPGGLLVISQAFLTTPQRYGQEIADGFDGAVKLMLKFPKQFRLVDARFEDRLGFAHNDGLIILRRV